MMYQKNTFLSMNPELLIVTAYFSNLLNTFITIVCIVEKIATKMMNKIILLIHDFTGNSLIMAMIK